MLSPDTRCERIVKQSAGLGVTAQGQDESARGGSSNASIHNIQGRILYYCLRKLQQVPTSLQTLFAVWIGAGPKSKGFGAYGGLYITRIGYE